EGNRPRPHKPPILITVPTGVAATTMAAAGGSSAAPLNRGSGGPSSGTGAGSYGGLPPAGGLRYVPDEGLVQVAANMPGAAVEALTRRMRLTHLESFTTGSVTMFRWRIPDRRPVPDVIRSLQGLVLAAQPNYLYRAEGEQPASGATEEKGEHWQYA